jgi:hypothetical protein
MWPPWRGVGAGPFSETPFGIVKVGPAFVDMAIFMPACYFRFLKLRGQALVAGFGPKRRRHSFPWWTAETMTDGMGLEKRSPWRGCRAAVRLRAGRKYLGSIDTNGWFNLACIQTSGTTLPRNSIDMDQRALNKLAHLVGRKYPPAEPGALMMGRSKRQSGSLTRPRLFGPPEGGRSTPHVELIQADILLFLLFDVFPDHSFVSPLRSRRYTPRPRSAAYEVVLPLAVDPGQVNRTLALDEADHL